MLNMYMKVSNSLDVLLLMDDKLVSHEVMDYNQHTLCDIFSKYIELELDNAIIVVDGSIYKTEDKIIGIKNDVGDSMHCSVVSETMINSLNNLLGFLNISKVYFINKTIFTLKNYARDVVIEKSFDRFNVFKKSQGKLSSVIVVNSLEDYSTSNSILIDSETIDLSSVVKNIDLFPERSKVICSLVESIKQNWDESYFIETKSKVNNLDKENSTLIGDVEEINSHTDTLESCDPIENDDYTLDLNEEPELEPEQVVEEEEEETLIDLDLSSLIEENKNKEQEEHYDLDLSELDLISLGLDPNDYDLPQEEISAVTVEPVRQAERPRDQISLDTTAKRIRNKKNTKEKTVALSSTELDLDQFYLPQDRFDFSSLRNEEEEEVADEVVEIDLVTEMIKVGSESDNSNANKMPLVPTRSLDDFFEYMKSDKGSKKNRSGFNLNKILSIMSIICIIVTAAFIFLNDPEIFKIQELNDMVFKLEDKKSSVEYINSEMESYIDSYSLINYAVDLQNLVDLGIMSELKNLVISEDSIEITVSSELENSKEILQEEYTVVSDILNEENGTVLITLSK